MDAPALTLRRARGSILVVVLVMILFASIALVAFIERASDDLLVEVRASDAAALRLEAYSALETTLAVLEDFRAVGGALRSPAEGWGDPLEWSGYEPGEGREVTVTFEDESGKLPLPRADFPMLVELFKTWNLAQADAERLTDALLGWAQKDYVAMTASAPRPDDYERAPLPFGPPGRSLRSFDELVSIDVVREMLFEDDGRPNELWHQFVSTVSLYDFRQPNVNSARPGVLAALARYDESQQETLSHYLNGTGPYEFQGPRYFQRANEVATVLGAQSLPQGFGAEIQALRIEVTVREALSTYRLGVVVAPPGGARPVKAVKKEGEEAEEATTAAPTTPATGPRAGADEPLPINYPFTLLEIRENDAPVALPAAAEDTP